ncbi:SDR family NAD(P)-dependent oxidoreductase [Terriglobus albidus]|uniref:SDR family NAD(P)-dependent oxidoreductase n=1 Tax=Terriglobus albidus TaxID=1592106 RepID=UPI0021E0E2FF|nr:SDR family oxidoreductase [Terriglobus albidus]
MSSNPKMKNQEQKKPLALVTGASSGIGWELAQVLATHGYDLVLVARREERLGELAETLARKYGAATQVLAIDLSQPGAAAQIEAELTVREAEIDVLVNNAGFSQHGPVTQLRVEQLHAIVQVNIIALMELTRLIAPSMMARHRGRILNVSSVVGFTPTPFATVYAATKAFVLSFSEGLAEELEGTGITVTAFCPGTTKTEFAETAGMTKTIAFRSGAMSAKEVAEIGYAGMMRGERVVISGRMNWWMVFGVRFAPRRLVARIAKRIMKPEKS